jgi:post-segregation antitoxin (ccd killing protein)
MKTYITICIDVDLAEKIKKEKINKSSLINSYLRHYFEEMEEKHGTD